LSTTVPDAVAKIELLLAESRKSLYRSPVDTVYFAELAQAAVERLETVGSGCESITDLQARVAAELANAYRAVDALDLAEHWLAQALRHFETGSREAALLALIADRTASLLVHERRFTEAFALLVRIFNGYVARGEEHLAGRTLLQRGLYSTYAGKPEEAVVFLIDGLDRIDLKREPLLALGGMHNLLLCAIELGRYELVRRILPNVAPLYGRENPLNLLRLSWIEGLVALGLGECAAAEVKLRDVQQGFLEVNLVFPASMAGLDLAHVLLRLGRVAEIPALAGELVSSFTGLRVGREVIVALHLLQGACERRRSIVKEVTLAINKVKQIVTTLTRR
jgi:hypothetical protein